jgi:hypothetical protein
MASSTTDVTNVFHDAAVKDGIKADFQFVGDRIVKIDDMIGPPHRKNQASRPHRSRALKTGR